MLLLLGNSNDLCVRESHALLTSRGIPAVLHEKGFADSLGLNWLLDDDNPAAGYFVADGQRIPFDAITGVLVRDYAPLPCVQFIKEDRNYIQNEVSAIKLGVLCNLDCPVIKASYDKTLEAKSTIEVPIPAKTKETKETDGDGNVEG